MSSRLYPLCCQSAYCGRTQCEGCRHLPEREAFERWREQTNAFRPDPVWSPSFWQARCSEPAS